MMTILIITILIMTILMVQRLKRHVLFKTFFVLHTKILDTTKLPCQFTRILIFKYTGDTLSENDKLEIGNY